MIPWLFGDRPGTTPDLKPGTWDDGMRTALVIGATALALAACGGGEGPTSSESQLDYSNAGTPRYSYAPYRSPSDIAWFDGQTYVGGDVEPQGGLRLIHTFKNGTLFYMGALRDGVGVDRLENYETDLTTQDGDDPYGLDGDGFFPFLIAPTLDLDPAFQEPENTEIEGALFDSLRMLNDALPPEYQVELGYYDDGDSAIAGSILVRLESASVVRAECGAQAVACARGSLSSLGYTRSSTVILPDDFDTSEYMHSRSVILHELLHALGIWGHVDSVEFPDSLIGNYGGYIPNVTHIFNRIDREVLQIMYMSQETDIYNDWGEWSDTSHHLAVRSEDEALNFGVALFNGLPQPWVRGATPDMDLADNRRLRGSATWAGNFVGYSGPSPLVGDVELQVRLSTLSDPDNEQDLRFRDIYYLNRFESDADDHWFPTRNIDYTVNVYNNQFANVRGEGYEEGWVTGVFLGSAHEHMGGTLRRTDMVGAFGGSRD